MIMVFSCKERPTFTEAKREAVRVEVRNFLDDNFTQIKEEGFVGELTSLDHSPYFYWIPPRKTMPISYDSVASILRKFTPGYKSVESIWDTLYIQPISEDIATYTGRFFSTYVDTLGRVSKFEMMEIGVAAKKDGQWKLISGQTSLAPQ
jgi:hypothetical protein